jgi:tetratricopeptide (TPR) repeat protein
VRIAHSLARQIYLPLGRIDDAESLLKETLEHALPALGPRHTEVIATRGSLATVHWLRGDLEEAAAGFRACVDDSRVQNPQPHFHTAALIEALARLHLDLGRPHEALPLAREAFEGRRVLFGDSARDTLRARETLGEALLESGATADAEYTLRETLRAFERFDPRDRYRWITACALAAAIARQGRSDEAEALADEACRALAQAPSTATRELTAARRRLNVIRQALGKPPEPEPPTGREAAPAEEAPPGR